MLRVYNSNLMHDRNTLVRRNEVAIMPTAKDIPKEALKEYLKVGAMKEYDQTVEAREKHDEEARLKRETNAASNNS